MSSNTKGVYHDDRHEHCNAPWFGRVQINGTRVYVGYHATREEAARAVRIHRLAAQYKALFPDLTEVA